jgi:hypothetical protein
MPLSCRAPAAPSNVVGHGGINILGGADFDRRVVNDRISMRGVQMFRPLQSAEFSHRTRPDFATILRGRAPKLLADAYDR